MQSREQSKYESPYNNVVEVGYNKVRIMELEVCRSRCQHNACNTTHNEGWDESNSKQVCRCKTDLSTPHRKEPVKDFDPGRYGNQHRGDGEKRVGYITQTCCKHVMRPYHEAQKGNQDGSKYHGACIRTTVYARRSE